MGSRPRGTGVIQIYEVSSGELMLVKDIERSNQMKCGTFKASGLRDRYLATGDFKVSFIHKRAILNLHFRRRARTPCYNEVELERQRETRIRFFPYRVN